MKIVIFVLTLVSSFAHSMECEVGRMARLTRPIEVSRNKDNVVKKYELAPGTEVHVIAIESGQIEIYAMRDSKGATINGYGQIPAKNMNFLKCD